MKIAAFFEKYALWGILVLAFGLRLHALDLTDFWYDEAFTGIALEESFGNMLTMVANDVHPPLYFVLAKPFAAWFGYSVFGIRFFSLLFGMLGIVGMYLFAKEVLGRKAALYAALVASISPFAIQYAQEGRMYTMLGALIMFASSCFVRALKTRSPGWYLAWGILLGGAYLTHYLAILFAPLFYPVLVLWRYQEEPERFRRGLRSIGSLLLPNRGLIFGYLVSILVFLPWMAKLWSQLGAHTLDWIRPAALSDIFLNLQIFLLGIPRGHYSGMPSPNTLWGTENSTIFVVITILTAFAIRWLWTRDRSRLSILLCFSLGFILILWGLSLLGRPYLVARYIIPSAYFTFIIVGWWLALVRTKTAILALSVYMLALLAIVPVEYATGFNQLSRETQVYQGKTLYVLNSFDYVIAKYYFGRDRLVLYNIDWPQYDSSIWAAIGKDLRKTEEYDTLKNDPNGLIIYNTFGNPNERSDRSFNPSQFERVAVYDNISVYRSQPIVR